MTPSPETDSALTADIGEIIERFVIVGDGGKPGIGQRRVGEAIKQACAARGGCDFGILNGDNIYPAGVLGVDDPQWETHFVEAFGDVGIKFYAALGNHDYGGITETEEVACSEGILEIDCLMDIGSAIGQATGGIGLDANRPQHQVDYASMSDVFVMDHYHYTFSSQIIDFAVLDTTPIYWNDINNTDSLRLTLLKSFLGDEMFEFAERETRAQETMLREWRASSSKRWRFAVAHHPYLSNGAHGNAGNYDGTGGLEGDGLPSGAELKSFLDTHVLEAGVHVYAYGHDHNLMDFGEHTLAGRERGTQMLLSGSGAKLTDARDDDEAENDSLYEITCYGFIMVEATQRALRLIYVTAPSGEDSQCADQDEAWRVVHSRIIDHY